jgi:glycosyltransferase involved in cell wall biosynthesis
MRVFIQDPWGTRGPGAYTYALASSLSSIGLDVHLVTNKYYDYDKLSHFKVIKIFFRYSEKILISKIRKMIRGIEYIASMAHLIFIYLNAGPDIIHIQWLLLYPFDFIWLKILRFMFRKRKTKLVLTAHNVLPHVDGQNYKEILLKIYSQFDALIVHSESLKSQVYDIFGESAKNWMIKIIPEGNSDIFFKKVKMEEVKKYLDLIKQKSCGRSFLFAGIIHKNKGLDLLLKAWEIHIENFSDDILYIVGKPEYNIENELKFIREKLNKTVRVSLGYKSDEELLAYYLSTDFVVLPYKEASQSGVLLTALTLGKPVIATKVGAITETVNFFDAGYLVSPNDIISLSKALNEAARISVGTLSKWSNAIRNKVKIELSWDKIAADTFKLYNILLGNRIEQI